MYLHGKLVGLEASAGRRSDLPVCLSFLKAQGAGNLAHGRQRLRRRAGARGPRPAVAMHDACVEEPADEVVRGRIRVGEVRGVDEGPAGGCRGCSRRRRTSSCPRSKAVRGPPGGPRCSKRRPMRGAALARRRMGSATWSSAAEPGARRQNAAYQTQNCGLNFLLPSQPRIRFHDMPRRGDGDRVAIGANESPAILAIPDQWIDAVGAGTDVERADRDSARDHALIGRRQEIGEAMQVAGPPRNGGTQVPRRNGLARDTVAMLQQGRIQRHHRCRLGETDRIVAKGVDGDKWRQPGAGRGKRLEIETAAMTIARVQALLPFERFNREWERSPETHRPSSSRMAARVAPPWQGASPSRRRRVFPSG